MDFRVFCALKCMIRVLEQEAKGSRRQDIDIWRALRAFFDAADAH